jgi:hypothetical protein
MIEETELLLGPDDAMLDEMKSWTIAQGGQQNMWNQFQFKSEADAVMFVLSWKK